MGTHQLMLMILSVVLVGIAVTLGVFLFQVYSENANRQMMIDDMNFLGTEAIRFWRTPVSLGGGAPEITEEDQEQLEFFLHWSGNTNSTASGTYTIQANNDGTIDITGVGTEVGRDNVNFVRATLNVNPVLKHPLNITIEN